MSRIKTLIAAVLVLSTKALAQEVGIEKSVALSADGTQNIFVRNTLIPALGEAWIDPSGMIWGDIAKIDPLKPVAADNILYPIVQSSEYMRLMYRSLPPYEQGALEYCQSIKVKLPDDEVLMATLPTHEDFIRLREYMGAHKGSSEGYGPKVLPNLFYTDTKPWPLSGSQTYGRLFWTSSTASPDKLYVFDGKTGAISDIAYEDDSFPHNIAVRCVVQLH